MALPIPRSTAFTIKKGDHGLPVFALQRVLNKLALPVSEDMAFGEQTETAVKALQVKLNVKADGSVGPATQAALAVYLCGKEEARSAGLPKRLLRSQLEGESGYYLAAVSWGSSGGVDCGVTQRRVYEAQYNDDVVVKRAFDAVYQIQLLGSSLIELHDIFYPRSGVKGNTELAWRLAVLNHNYPAAADKISRVGLQGLSSYWTTPAKWVEAIGARFTDGVAVRTPLQWCQKYSLGSSVHNDHGTMVKYVIDWR